MKPVLARVRELELKGFNRDEAINMAIDDSRPRLRLRMELTPTSDDRCQCEHPDHGSAMPCFVRVGRNQLWCQRCREDHDDPR